MSDPFAWHKAALAGTKPPIHDQAQCGWFRKRQNKDGPWLPAVIWIDATGTMVCRIGDKMYEPQDQWLWLCKNPMPAPVVRAVFKGEPWPDEVSLGHNRPPMELPDEIADQVETAQSWLKQNGKIETQVACDMAANMAARLTKLATTADNRRKEEKQPHLDAGRDVDERWGKLIDPAKRTAAELKKIAGTYMLAQQRKLEREAAEKAEAERAKALENGEVSPSSEVKPVEPIKIQAGGARGRKLGLMTVKVAVIVDYDATYNALRAHPDMVGFVQELANRAVKAGVPLAGVEVKEEGRAR